MVRLFLLMCCAAAVYAAPGYESTVQPFVAKHCAGCHNGAAKTGGIDLVSFRTGAAAQKSPEVWEKVLERLEAGSMPPKGFPRPSTGEIAAVTNWIATTALRAESRRKPDPGRVTAHRLNKFEYNKTVEDLLGIRYRPADDFPADDSGYGFDNIGDVLSLSPVLMEKYLAAAETISQLAVGTDPLPKPATQRFRNAPSGARSFLDMSAKPRVIYDADYDVRAVLAGRRQEGSITGAMALYLDGKELRRWDVDTRSDKPHTFETRVHLDGGEHEVRVLVLDDDYDLSIKANRDRNVVVDFIEVRGPFPSDVAGAAESRKRIFICGHAKGQHTPECARRLVSDLARRAWRRPVTGAEVDSLMRFVKMAEQEGDSMEEGVRVALKAMLVSPQFLFRIERDPNPNSPEAVHPLNNFELASRLSYFLWSSMPDEELFHAAEAGTLRNPEVLRAQVRRMLRDAKASRLVENFAGQWLELRNLDAIKPDPKRFPEFDSALRAAMKMETTLFFDSIVREDRSITDLIDARYTFLNERLARHYGVKGVQGDEFRRVELDAKQRGGILTQGSVLTVTSYPTRTSPVLRGKWLLENILGAPPPPPPPDVPALDESQIDAGATLRAQMEQHRTNPMCASCHMKMDPLGFAFENYDAIGRYRTHEGKADIDASGTLPDGRKFEGAPELKALLRAQAPDFARCLTEKMLTYALGRGLERYDKPAVDSICRRMSQSGYKFSSLVAEIAGSMPFQMRRGEGVKQ